MTVYTTLLTLLVVLTLLCIIRPFTGVHLVVLVIVVAGGQDPTNI
jgi:hypothetical protein